MFKLENISYQISNTSNFVRVTGKNIITSSEALDIGGSYDIINL